VSTPASKHLKVVASVQKKGRGAPKKFIWDDRVDTEIHRRMVSGEACEKVEWEARELRFWLHDMGIFPFVNANKVDQKKPNGYERIRERLKKRYGGTSGYNNARKFHLMKSAARDKSG
jgi:hypothetical protein